MRRLDRQQLANLVFLTFVWGLNWPVMKMGVTGYPALTFRAWSIMLGVLVAASTWALGTQMLRRTRIELPTLTQSFWMTTLTGIVITLLALVVDGVAWQMPSTAVNWAIATTP